MVKPSIGRIVHYVSYGTPRGEYGQQCRAALVTEVDASGEKAGLAVLNPTGLFFCQDCPRSEDAHRGGTWHGPECAEGRRTEVRG